MNFFHSILFTILITVHVSNASPIKPIELVVGLEEGIKPIHKEIKPLNAIFAGEIEFKQEEPETPGESDDSDELIWFTQISTRVH